MIPRKGFRVARFRGIDVYLHWSWFIVFALLLWVVIQFFQLNGDSSPAAYLPMSLVTTILFFASVLLHELSHSMVALRNGIPILRITLFVFGGVAQMGKDVTSPGVEFKMAVAGPMCSYVLCLIFGGAAYLSGIAGSGTISYGFMLLSAVNFGLGTFNLVPGFPLDGGRILRSMLWHHWGDLKKSTRTASLLGQGVGALLITGGVTLFLVDVFHGGNDYLFASVWFTLIGFFLMQAASSSYRQIRLRVALSGLYAGDLLRPGVPSVDVSSTLEEVYRQHLQWAPAAVMPVLRQGRLAASVGMPQVRQVKTELWGDTPVSAVARPVREGEAVSLATPLFEALLLMERAGRDFLWVTEEGRLAGILLREDIRRRATLGRD